MGRSLTPEELAEFEAKRKAESQKIAKIFGLSIEQLEKLRRQAAEEIHSDDRWEKELNERKKTKSEIEKN